MMKFWIKAITISTVLLCVTFSPAQLSFDARSAAMAYSNGADLQGLEQIGGNPATLALYRPFNFELNLLSLNVSFFNNSFTKSFYDRYFTTGDTLTESDINDILNTIPSNGIKAYSILRFNTLALYARNFSLSLEIVGDGFFYYPHSDVFELIFRGNSDLGRQYSLGDLQGNFWGGLAANLAFAFPLKIKFLEDHDFTFFAAGMALKYLAGLGYVELLHTSGTLDNQADGLSIHADGQARSSRGGKGFTLDVGFIAQRGETWTFSLALLNPIGSIRWTKQNEKFLFSMEANKLSFPDRLADTLITHTDTSYAIDAFSTHLPAVLDMAVAYQWKPSLLVTGEYEQGLNRSMGGTTTPRFAVGIEYKPLPILPLRAGLSMGGKTRFALALGSGLNLKFWYLDVAMVNHGGLLPSHSEGFSLALTSRFRF